MYSQAAVSSASVAARAVLRWDGTPEKGGLGQPGHAGTFGGSSLWGILRESSWSRTPQAREDSLNGERACGCKCTSLTELAGDRSDTPVYISAHHSQSSLTLAPIHLYV